MNTVASQATSHWLALGDRLAAAGDAAGADAAYVRHVREANKDLSLIHI